VVPDSGIGSISGGGRYDDLTGVFGLKDVSGVGISFGVDRIYEILEGQNLWPDNLYTNESILICHFDSKSQLYGNKVADHLRKEGLSVIVYPETKRINKQFDFANKIGVKYAIVVGEDEMNSGTIALKNLQEGSQKSMSVSEAILQLKN